jgi:predicted transcriptional regulator
MPKPIRVVPSFSDAIRSAAKREGLGLEQYRRKHDIPSAHFYKLAQGRHPIPEKVRVPLLKLRAAGVEHPLLDLVA